MTTGASPRSPSRLATTARRAAIALACQLAAGAGVLGAQDTMMHAGAPAPDTATATEEAKRAQRRFEGIRQGALRVVESRGPSPCEVRVGRYCYWYDTSARPPVPRESERVTVARRQFLSVLDSLGAVSPRDAWIAGQRVRYRVDALDTAGAVGVATSGCRTPGWWCDALRGYALHIAGRHPAAERAFDRVLAAMPAEDRCAWENPSALLERSARDRVQRMSCEDRRLLAARLLWLGDPQLGRPGNDLRSEFLARRVESVLESDARFVYGVRWSWDTSELLIRFGWPTWWTRERSYPASGPGDAHLVGHERVPAFNFLPAPRAVLDPAGTVHNEDWSPAQDSPAMRYAPPYLTWWRHASAQVGRLRRGDTLLVVAAFEAPDSTLRRAEAVLVLAAGPGGAVHASSALSGALGVLQARMPRPRAGAEVLASVEVVDTARRAMARYRESAVQPPEGRLVLSSLLLHRPLSHSRATTALEDVVDHMLPTRTIAGERVAVFWETYGVADAGEPLEFVLTIERVDPPWLRRAAARLRLADPVTPVHIRWRESPRVAHGIAARTMAVNVAKLASGEYRLRLRARGADGAEAASERVIQVRFGKRDEE